MTFSRDIKKFNNLYGLKVNEKPTLLGIEQIENFKSILQEELNEVDEIIKDYKKNKNKLDKEKEIEILTNMSDWLGDMVVYITSEATKYGIDLGEVLKIIMQSNFSKLGKDGKPIYDERGKVLKGPDYWKPEGKIKEYLLSK